MNKKILLLLLCVVVIGSLTVAGTVAYFADTDAATNTFSIGEVGLTLDEAKVNPDGTVVPNAGRVSQNEYHLVPGYTYTKDPIVHIDADSSDAWIFVRVVNEIAAIEGGTTVAQQMEAKGWTLVSGETDVYAYKETVSAGADIPVFDSFTVDGSKVSGATLDGYNGKTITVTGYAVQADGFDTAAKAWDAYTEQNKEQNG